MNSNLLALLKRIQVHSASDYDECPACYKSKHSRSENGHQPDCELKAHIDRLEAEESDEMRIKSLELEYTKKVSDDIEHALRQCGFRKLGENTNEGSA